MTTTYRTITLFERETSAASAERALLETDEEMTAAEATGLVHYPYRVFGIGLRAKALFEEYQDRVYCGVDLCQGKELFIGERPTLVERSIDTDTLISADESVVDPERTARQHVLELSRTQLRVGSAPELGVVEDRRVHRPFHVVECETVDGVFLTYIVDGVSGDFHRVYLD